MLSGGGVHVTSSGSTCIRRFPLRMSAGLGSPAPGDRLIGARVRICSNVGPAIGTWDFGLSLSGGGSALMKFPQRNYADGFDSLSTGCEQGLGRVRDSGFQHADQDPVRVRRHRQRLGHDRRAARDPRAVQLVDELTTRGC